MSAYDTAVLMYKHQHERWNHWALFFFGLVGSSFVIKHYAQDAIPMWVPALTGMILSAMWILVALNIRATAHAWLHVILDIEEALETQPQNKFKPFALFDRKFQDRPYKQDLKETFLLHTPEPYRRVTRLMTLLGFLMGIGFCILFFKSLF